MIANIAYFEFISNTQYESKQLNYENS